MTRCGPLDQTARVRHRAAHEGNGASSGHPANRASNSGRAQRHRALVEHHQNCSFCRHFEAGRAGRSPLGRSLRRLAVHDPAALAGRTSGLPTYGGYAYQQAVAEGQSAWTIDALLARTNARRLLFDPGKGWAYSNIGYLLIRQLLERTTTSNIDAAIHQLVFAPLQIPELAHRADDIGPATNALGKPDKTTTQVGSIMAC